MKTRLLVAAALASVLWDSGEAQSIAQLSRADSIAIATALAPSVREMIKPPAIMQDNARLLRDGAPWNAFLQTALERLNPSNITRTPAVTTDRFNVFTLIVAPDSVVANVGVTQCNGSHFGGASNRFVLKQSAGAWRVVSKAFSGSGSGKCG